jgi:hypothetical protein
MVGMKTSCYRYVSLLGYRQGRWLITPLTVSDPSFLKVAGPLWSVYRFRWWMISLGVEEMTSDDVVCVIDALA